MELQWLGWAGLFTALSLTTFGVWGCVTLLLGLLVLIIGILGILYIQTYYAGLNYQYELLQSRLCPPGFPIQRVGNQVKQPEPMFRSDHRLTGSSVVDEPLHEIIEFIFRDFVDVWYTHVSDDPNFLMELRLSTQKMLVAFAQRSKEVDWIPYLTTRLVDDVASHLRLFKQARTKLKKQSQDNEEQPSDLISLFFNLEVRMEDNILCRDLICTVEASEREYLQDLTEVILFLLLPRTDFHNKPLRYLVREIIVNMVLLPLVQLLTDPDYFNQTIVWLCSDFHVTSDVFIMVLRITDSLDELQATREMISKEISQLRSRDSGQEDDMLIKQQLSSLQYIRHVIDSRVHRLQEGTDTDSAGLPSQIDWNKLLTPGYRLFSLPLDVVLKNNIALAYFIDYMTSIGAQAYLFFYLNVEGWKVSAEQQLNIIELEKISESQKNDDSSHSVKESSHFDRLDKTSSHKQILDNMREAAHSIYEQYLSEKASPRLRLEDTVVKRLILRIRSEPPSENWFDEIQVTVYEKLQEERFLPGFKKTTAYVKLLAELDLLKDPSRSDEEDTQSLDDVSLSDSISLNSLEVDDEGTDRRSNSPSLPVKNELKAGHRRSASTGSVATSASSITGTNSDGRIVTSAEIVKTNIIQQTGKSYAMYTVSVRHVDKQGQEELWQVCRRYSDFDELRVKVKERFDSIILPPFPGKRTFNNMDPWFLSQRLSKLNHWLSQLVIKENTQRHPGLSELVLQFFDPGHYEKGKGQLARKLDTLVCPIKSSVKSVTDVVRSVPDSLVSTVDDVMDGISRAFTRGNLPDPTILADMKVGASLDQECNDNIPLRIMLLLMDEVFDLKSRNQWLRRRIVILLRQIIKTMFGDIYNRRIVEWVAMMTSPQQVAEYLKTFKNVFWPNGCRAEPGNERDEATKMRTRVATKAAMLAGLSDELKHIIGSETARRGIMVLFEMCQQPVLNRRLCYILLEGILETLFADHNFTDIFQKLHSRSPRVRDDLRNSQRDKQELHR